MTVSQIPQSQRIHTSTQPFQLPQEFINTFKDKIPPFGFNGLGELVYLRTYSRTKQNGVKEKWYETVNRVVNGTFNMQKNWTLSHYLPWDETNALQSAKEMYTRIFDMKFLPPGRGLWAMGSPLTEERKLFAALNNCAFVTTEDLASDPAKPFLFLMDASMLGVGVGFDTKGAKAVIVKGPNNSLPTATYQIPDSREGWVKSVQLQLESYFQHTNRYVFDYSLVRAAGLPIRGFGGISSGPGSLMALHEGLATVLDASVGQKISSTTIVDIMNLIGKCVVSGNLRRTAEIAFGEADDEEYINLKNYEKNPHRVEFGWTSNNSVFAKVGMDYSKFTKLIVNNGEPGFAWLDNMRKYDRMDGVVTNTDIRAKGGNPCLEQTLESYEMCCLVETFPHRHESYEDYEQSLKSAFLYAKTVTLGQTHWPETNQILFRNRRIGTSMSGVAQFISQRGMDEFRKWCENGYTFLKQFDTAISEQFAIPRSIKSTSIKPSGTVSLLAGATPGVHYPISRFYLRRVRIAKDSDLLPPLQKAGYHVEPAVGNEATTAVVSFPVDSGEGIRKLNDVSMWEQLSIAAFLQRYWADNQVSCTVTFDPETEGPQLSHALDIFQYQLKGISFLPKFAAIVYPQMPYEEIDEATFNALAKKLSPIDWTGSKTDSQMERFCDSDVCSLPV